VLLDSGCECARTTSAAEAVNRAAPGSAVLILADGYPDTRTSVPPEVFERATAKNLRLYVEYPAAIPGLAFGEPQQTSWERAVVASDRGGLADQVADGETGLLVPPGDAGALAAAMARLLADGDLRARMGEAGRRRFERGFSAAAVIGRIEALYERVLSGTVATRTRSATIGK
jgi:glycosyltransferase involved in cell wall biosynthesis